MALAEATTALAEAKYALLGLPVRERIVNKPQLRRGIKGVQHQLYALLDAVNDLTPIYDSADIAEPADRLDAVEALLRSRSRD